MNAVNINSFTVLFLLVSLMHTLVLIVTRAYAQDKERKLRLAGMFAAWVGFGIEAIFHSGMDSSALLPEFFHSAAPILIGLGGYFVLFYKKGSQRDF